MYKIIVADDEDDVRKGIIERISWEEYGFTVIGEAENGKEALELYEAEMPDVIITDINMPYINGLELLETLNTRYPKPIVVFLTAYDEFEYAQKAVSLSAAEYILKPITSEELTGLLKRLKNAMDDAASQREDINFLRREFENNLPVLREKFLSLLLNGRLSAGNIEQKSRAYGMETLMGKSCMIGIIMADDEHEPNAETAFETEQKELMQFAIYNIANEIMEVHQRGITFLYGDNVILISLGENEETLTRETLQTFEEIGQSIKKYLRFTVTIGAGYCCGKTDGIKDSYHSAITACNYKMLLGGDRVIYILDMEPANPPKDLPGENVLQGLIHSIRSAVQTEVDTQIDTLFADALCCHSTDNGYIPYIFEVVTAILKTAKDLGVDTAALMDSNPSPFRQMMTITNLPGVKQWVKQTCATIVEEAASKRQDINKMMVKKAIQYIREHYAEPDTDIETVCRHIHISQSYFCSIFKKETNDTFRNSLHLFRMQAAKELLRMTDMKLREVAERVGYTDPNYFSFSFKKTTGISPREYRNLQA